MLFLPHEIATMLEEYLNNTQEDLEDPFIFRTDTLVGRYTRDYFFDEYNQKKEFIYSVVTDPVGEIYPLQNSNCTTQQVDLHIYFKIQYRTRMYEAIDKFLSNISGKFVSIPGTNLESGVSTKVTFKTDLPYFGDPNPQNIETVNKRTGIIEHETFDFMEAIIPIKMTTSAITLLMGNEITYELVSESSEEQIITEKLLLAKDSNFGVKTNSSTEQYLGESSSTNINSYSSFQCSLSFFVNGLISEEIMKMCFDENYSQNQKYMLNVKKQDELIGTKKVIMIDPTTNVVVGGYVIVSATFVTADDNLI